jgi:holo-[acyl-carrier protein] synthase
MIYLSISGNAMIIGTGIDIVSVERVRKLVDSGGDRFKDRCFAPGEIAYCEAKAKPFLHYAARLAAKEATVKALRLEWDGPPAWKDIEVAVAPSGAPSLALAGAPRATAERLGVVAFHLSLSHCDEYATASVIAESGPALDPRP